MQKSEQWILKWKFTEQVSQNNAPKLGEIYGAIGHGKIVLSYWSLHASSGNGRKFCRSRIRSTALCRATQQGSFRRLRAEAENKDFFRISHFLGAVKMQKLHVIWKFCNKLWVPSFGKSGDWFWFSIEFELKKTSNVNKTELTSKEYFS